MIHPNNLHTFDDLLPEDVREGMRAKEREPVPKVPSALLSVLAAYAVGALLGLVTWWLTR